MRLRLVIGLVLVKGLRLVRLKSWVRLVSNGVNVSVRVWLG